MSDKLAISDWRNKIRKYQEVTEEHKSQFIDEVRRCGRMTTAAETLGIGYNSIRTCLKKDEELQEAVEMAIQMYRDQMVGDIEHQGWKGTQRTSYNSNGDIIKSETVYETPIRVKILQAHDKKTYTPTQNIDITSGGKPLGIVPATSDPDEWERQAAELNARAEEAEFEE